MMNGNGGPRKLIEFDWDDPKLPIQVFVALTDEDVGPQQVAGIMGLLMAQQCLLLKRIHEYQVGAGKTTADEPVPDPLQENLFDG